MPIMLAMTPRPRTASTKIAIEETTSNGKGARSAAVIGASVQHIEPYSICRNDSGRRFVVKGGRSGGVRAHRAKTARILGIGTIQPRRGDSPGGGQRNAARNALNTACAPLGLNCSAFCYSQRK